MADENNQAITVLVVEDEISLQKALVEKLQTEGFRILVAGDGDEGLRIAQKEEPTLILLDILMPKMDGISMMKQVRMLGEWGMQVPIIILTNLSPDQLEVGSRASEGNPAYYLIKADTTIDTIIQKIKELLSLS